MINSDAILITLELNGSINGPPPPLNPPIQQHIKDVKQNGHKLNYEAQSKEERSRKSHFVVVVVHIFIRSTSIAQHVVVDVL